MMEAGTEQRFTDYLVEAADRAQREAGYNPTLFRQMLGSEGGYLTTVKLLSANRVSDGFQKLWEKGRLDLSVEALILHPQWVRHFASELVGIAQKRLRDVGFPVPLLSDGAGAPGHAGPKRSWVLYHKQHEAPFGGDSFHCKAGPNIGDRAFVVLGDKPRNTSYLLNGEYEVQKVERDPKPFNGKSYACKLHLVAIAKPENPILLDPVFGEDDRREFLKRHVSGRGIQEPDERTLATFRALLAGAQQPDDRSTDIAELAEAGAPRTTIEQQIEARLGQGRFRQAVVETWGIGERCALTETAVRAVLTASHIIPWAEDEGLRLEGTNGVLLCAHVDRLFDRHLVSFDTDGKLTGSARMNSDDWDQLAKVGIKRGMQLKTLMLNLTAKHLVFDRFRRHRARMQELDERGT
jgi:hypothetical protein